MTYDPSSQIAMDAQPFLKQLIVQERVANDKRQQRDVRKQAEKLRAQLLQLNPDAPTVLRTYLTATGVADGEALKTAWQQMVQPIAFEQQGPLKSLFDSIWALPSLDLTMLPTYTFAIQFTFTLAQPYLSKDDNPFYIIDNPLVRDKVFRLPMVRPSSWKGSLRRALWQQGHQDDGDTRQASQIQRLFGDANDDDDHGQSGRLRFYPTFFDKTSLEIINPHDRIRRVGKNPILLEAVPAGATGTFTLLYVPLDRIGQDEAETRAQVAADLTLVTAGVQAMFTLYGFGAKTSSGFGLAAEQLTGGTLLLNHPDGGGSERPPRPVEPPPPPQPPALRTYLAEFPNEDFALKPDEWRKRRNATNSQREAYKAARGARSDYLKALADYQQALARYQAEVAAWESIANTPQPPQMERTFTDFTQLVEQAQTVANVIHGNKEVRHDPIR